MLAGLLICETICKENVKLGHQRFRSYLQKSRSDCKNVFGRLYKYCFMFEEKKRNNKVNVLV